MKLWTKTLSSVALLGVVATGPAIAGHYGSKDYGAAHGGPSKGGQHAMHGRYGHPVCRSRMMSHKGKGYGHGPYKGPGWAHGGPHRFGHHGRMKHKGYGYGRPMMGPHYGMKRPYDASPKSAPTTQPRGSGEATNAAPKDIVQTALASDQFATLVSAVKAAELVDTLSGAGPFTVFAPTDAAFRKLPEGTVTGLLDNTDALKDVLTYHVVQGRVTAADLLEQGAVETLSGSALSLSQLKVAKADVPASNGVIHILDEVLLPPQE